MLAEDLYIYFCYVKSIKWTDWVLLNASTNWQNKGYDLFKYIVLLFLFKADNAELTRHKAYILD